MVRVFTSTGHCWAETVEGFQGGLDECRRELGEALLMVGCDKQTCIYYMSKLEEHDFHIVIDEPKLGDGFSAVLEEVTDGRVVKGIGRDGSHPDKLELILGRSPSLRRIEAKLSQLLEHVEMDDKVDV